MVSQLRKTGRCLPKNSQNTQFATFNLGCKKFSWRELFSSQPFLTLHVFYGVLNYAKLDVAWRKTVKTHNLPRLIWAAKSSRGANFFHSSHFARYTSFTASQPRNNGRCLAKNSQNTHFATFTLGCKKFPRYEVFSSQPFPTLHVFYGVPTTQKWPLPGQKQSKHIICHVYFGLQKILVAGVFFVSAISHVTRLLRCTKLRKNGRFLAQNSENKHFATFNLSCKKFSWNELFSSQPFPTLHIFYGVPTTQNWPLLAQKQSKHTICHV